MVQTNLVITIQQAPLFNQLQPVPVPAWLTETLAKDGQLAFISEKSRSEFIVADFFQSVSRAA